MISFHQFRLKEALSLDDPLAQSTLKIIDKSHIRINFEFTLNNNNYKITTSRISKKIYLQNQTSLDINLMTELDRVNLMTVLLKVNDSFELINQLGMQANTVYNMLLNAMKQAHDHFGENNIEGYTFSGAQYEQDIMYHKLMKRFVPNLIIWSPSIFLKPETIQRIKDKNPDLINQINNKIHQETSQREMLIQQNKEYKSQQRSLRNFLS
jgi:DNA polymerase III delta prime subunit